MELLDVVIVGAGLSGLTTARELLKRNVYLKILILEGKGRVGGRTVTLCLPAAKGEDSWDLGGQWVGRTQTHILDLIQELGLEIYPQYTEGKKVYRLGGSEAEIRTYTSSIPPLSLLGLIDMQLLLWKIDKLRKTVSVEIPGSSPNALEYDSMTLHSFIKKHTWTQEVRAAMELSCRSVFGMETSQLSFLYFLMYGAAAGGFLALLEATAGSAQEYKVKGGTQQLSEILADRVGRQNIRLSSAVTGIHQDSGIVEVRTESEAFKCKTVIVTSPPHLAFVWLLLLVLSVCSLVSMCLFNGLFLSHVGWLLQSLLNNAMFATWVAVWKSSDRLIWLFLNEVEHFVLQTSMVQLVGSSGEFYLGFCHLVASWVTTVVLLGMTAGNMPYSAYSSTKIHYQPPLPVERESLTQNMPMGHMMKFIVTYPTTFWRENGFSGEIVTQPSSECPFSVTYDATSTSGNPALVGFIAGAQAADWCHRELEDRRDAVIQTLTKFLGPEASNYIHYAEKDWAKEQYSGGCPVNIMVPGMITYFHPSLRRPCGRIHWAGTETATLWCGYLSGAVQSGQRVALEVLGQLSPECLSQEEKEWVRTSLAFPVPHRDWKIAPGSSSFSAYLLLSTAALGAALLWVHPWLSQVLIERGLSILQKAYVMQ
ncbi:AOFA oxidase, partial [Atractosteus spatula]|nr:AOFA oxidase [Atractosteus spatula]